MDRNERPAAGAPEREPWDFPEVAPVSPLRLFMATLAVVFAAELAIMIWLEYVWGAPEAVEVAVDSIVLAAVTTPVLYCTLYKPLNRYLEQAQRAAEAVRYSERKYQTLVENSPAGIFFCRDGVLGFVNRRMGQLFGRADQSLVGVDPLELVHPEDRERVAALLDPAAARGGEGEEVEFRVARPDGELCWVSARSAPVRYRGATSVLGMATDITPRKRLEAELRHLSSQRLAVQEEERRRLARELHDGVGQALSAVKFMVELALGEEYPNERREQMEQLRTMLPKIQGAVEDVRRLAMSLRPPTLDDLGLRPTVTWFLREFGGACPHLQLQQVLDLAEEDVPEALKITVFRTLQEAVNNAAKHCGECTVEVALARRGDRLVLEVRDDGDGFEPAQVLSREPGARGFGLLSMRERVELSGGEFSLDSAPGGGTTVRAVWPAAGAATPA